MEKSEAPLLHREPVSLEQEFSLDFWMHDMKLSDEVAHAIAAISDPEPLIRAAALQSLDALQDVGRFCDAFKDAELESGADVVLHFCSSRGASEGAPGTLEAPCQADACMRELLLELFDSLDSQDDIPSSKEQIPLLGLLKSEDALVRSLAATVLSSKGSDVDSDDIHALRLALRDEDLRVRNAAADSLAHFGGLIWTDLPSFRDSFHGKDVYMRRVAVAGLLLSDIEDDEVLAMLQDALADEDAEARVFAARGLLMMSNESADVVSVLRFALRHGEASMRRYVIAMLQKGSHSAVASLAVCLGALRDEDSKVRFMAHHLLLSLRFSIWPNGIAGVRAALSDEDVTVRRAAASALSGVDMGQGMSIEASAVVQALADPDPGVRWSVTASTGDVPAIWGEDVELLHATIQHGDDFSRQAAVASLGSFEKPLSQQDLDALIAALEHDDIGTRWCAASALAELGDAIGWRGKFALKKAVMTDDDYMVVDVAWQALRGMGRNG